MKNLMKLLIVAIALTMTTESFAQTFGIKAGLNLSNMHYEEDAVTYSDGFRIKHGFHLGVSVEYPINEMISFETALLLSNKGYKHSGKDDTGTEVNSKASLFYIDIPFTAKASYRSGSAVLYGIFGPYFGIGLYGKIEYERLGMGETVTLVDDISWGSDGDDDLKRLDFGLTTGVGIEINSIGIGMSYTFGLANIFPNAGYRNIPPNYNGTKGINRVLGISLSYKFGGK